MAQINTTFFQLVAAFFVAFVLAHITTRYFERFERFPSPLVTPGPGVPMPVQGRDYIPHNRKPTLPPGPAIPAAQEVDGALHASVPAMPMPQPQGMPTDTPKLPYAMTNDEFLSFVTPERTMSMSTIAPLPSLTVPPGWKE